MSKLLTATELSELLKISRVQVWRATQAGKLPKPIYLGPKSPRWRSDEIDAVIERASAEREAV